MVGLIVIAVMLSLPIRGVIRCILKNSRIRLLLINRSNRILTFTVLTRLALSIWLTHRKRYSNEF